MIAQSNKIQENILDIKYGRIQQGLKIGVDEMDEFIQFKQGNFNIVIGHANVGKTTVILYLFTLWAIKHNLRFLVWSSENTPQSLVRKIIEFKIEIDNKNLINKDNDKIINVPLMYIFKSFIIYLKLYET